ncbi:Energy-coupling factor transporter ATP-binding protein EcfA1 [Candidatus Izimaplasma bacterium HR1]|jgi:energy-coupling factor transport system ATP-binding protein|uniref:energy-coupling factor ABC transporter ATP-binding protein n=1 Tax=Candidatus Izimoplasma sp. HR1 TaxID=1541959 RepID=UPI0004F7978A|nr:Energy-coupling factor transporter ATP-binding protein EcfA1 [Candidatus Izimaplasma bacterium HR1]
MQPVLSMKNVSFKYLIGKEKVFEDISLDIYEGEFVAIAGKNGSGKTTLCNLLRGFIPHLNTGKLSGEILLRGESIPDTELSELADKIGYIFQNPFIQDSGIKETVYEEIGFGLENLGVPRDLMIERIESTIKLLKIEDLQDKHPAELSGGQRQRVAIASILAMDPGVLIIDEPTSQLDPQGTEEIFEIIKLLKEQKKTIILVEHKIDQVAEYADRVILLSDKKIIFDGPTNEIFANEKVMEYGTNLPQVAKLGIRYNKEVQKIEKIPTVLKDAVKVFKK